MLKWYFYILLVYAAKTYQEEMNQNNVKEKYTITRKNLDEHYFLLKILFMDVATAKAEAITGQGYHAHTNTHSNISTSTS